MRRNTLKLCKRRNTQQSNCVWDGTRHNQTVYETEHATIKLCMGRNTLRSNCVWDGIRYDQTVYETEYATIKLCMRRNTLRSNCVWDGIRYDQTVYETEYATIKLCMRRNTLRSNCVWDGIRYDQTVYETEHAKPQASHCNSLGIMHEVVKMDLPYFPLILGHILTLLVLKLNNPVLLSADVSLNCWLGGKQGDPDQTPQNAASGPSVPMLCFKNIRNIVTNIGFFLHTSILRLVSALDILKLMHQWFETPAPTGPGLSGT